MASLPELQARFSAALRGDPDALVREVSSGGIDAAGRVSIYRSNSLAMFEGALERTYPVLRRRVGDDYFHQLARGYRARHPSRSGDLHWIGEHFPGYVAHTETGTGYEWLAELAALEWACETALVARQEPAVGLAALAGLPPDQLGATGLRFQPSLRCIASSFPVLDVWRANQPG
ncbi:MAG TPA: DNA-binding domain-containing protein, partial [Steroidobacteraceae bacterium]|nr:DNA-binding domain-containing protein [Steroidobacteraceae bacterium]